MNRVGSRIDNSAGRIGCVATGDDGEGIVAGVGVGGADCVVLVLVSECERMGGGSWRGRDEPRVKSFTLHSTPVITLVWSCAGAERAFPTRAEKARTVILSITRGRKSSDSLRCLGSR